MNAPLAAILLLLGAAGAALTPKRIDPEKAPTWGLFGAALVAGLLISAALGRFTGIHAAIGAFSGVLCALVVGLFARARGVSSAASIGLGAGAAGVIQALTPGDFGSGMGCMLCGFGLVAWILDAQGDLGVSAAALVAGAVGCIDVFAHEALVPVDLGLRFGVAATVVALVVDLLRTRRKHLELPAILLGAAVFAGIAFALSQGRIPGSIDPKTIWLAAVAAGTIAIALRDFGPLPSLLSTLVWAFIGVQGFSEGRGFGIGMLLCVAALVLALIRNPSATASIVPLAAIAFFRWYRILRPEVSDSFEISQIYAFVGLILGAMLASAPSDWAARLQFPRGGRALVGLIAWVAMAIAAAPAAHAMLGVNGATGLAMGLGLSAVIAQAKSVRIAGLVVGLAAYAPISFGWVHSDVSRDDKVKVLVISMIVAAALAAAISLAKVKPQETAS